MSTLVPKYNKWIILGIFNFLYSVCLVMLAYASKLILDHAALKDKNMVIIYAGIFFGIIFIAVLFKFIQNALYSRFVVKREMQLKRLLYEQRLKINFASSNIHTGLLLQGYITDVANIVSGELDTLPQVFYEVGSFVVAVGLVILIDWKFLVILVTLGLLGLLAVRFYSVKMKKHHQKNLAIDGVMNSYFQESIENLKLIQAYDAGKNFLDSYSKKEQDAIRIRRKKLIFQVIAGNVIVFGSNLIYGVSITYGGLSIAVGVMTYGSLTALLQLMGYIQNPILSLSGIINKYTLYKSSLKRLEEKLIGEELICGDLNDFDSIELKDVSFGYDECNLFTNLNLTINKGDIIRISGESGIGKTSLFMILLGFLKPRSGSINVISDNNIFALNGGLFSFVSQENILFSGTIKENFELLVGDSLKIEESLKFANLYDEIMMLPNGLDTVLSERGAGLSVGQLQRLIIAIAYAKGRPIFLLDEFTSALDDENAKIISNNIINSGKTVIYISHKEEAFIPNKIIKLNEYK